MTLLVSLLFALTLASELHAPASQTPNSPSPTPSTQAPPPAYKPSLPAPSSNDPPSGPSATVQAEPPPATYIIGPQDLLKITVFDEPDLNTNNQHRVDADGTINYPFVGRVAAAGLTVPQLQTKLTAQLADGYIKNPQVRVEVEQYKSQSIFVFGEVRTPNKISMTGSMSLLEALAAAGSPNSGASTEVTITRPRTPNAAGTPPVPGREPEGDKTVIDIRDTVAAQAFMLHDNDVVTVSKAQTIYVSGQVRNPGQIIWQRGMTLATAVTTAGGLSERGTYRGAYATRLVKGVPTEVKLDEQDKIIPDDQITIKPRLF